MSAAQKSETPLAGGAIAENQNTDAAIVAPTENLSKALATVKAELAIKGHAVFDLSDGAFLVTRWGLTRRCADLAGLQDFARQIGGAQ